MPRLSASGQMRICARCSEVARSSHYLLTRCHFDAFLPGSVLSFRHESLRCVFHTSGSWWGLSCGVDVRSSRWLAKSFLRISLSIVAAVRWKISSRTHKPRDAAQRCARRGSAPSLRRICSELEQFNIQDLRYCTYNPQDRLSDGSHHCRNTYKLFNLYVMYWE